MQKIKDYISAHRLLAVVIVSLIFIIGVLLVSLLNIYPKTKIDVLVAPASASVTIDGKVYENGTYDLPKGKVTVTIEKDGFSGKEYIFDTSSDNKLYDYLVQTDGSWSWYETHPEDAIILTQIGDYESSVKSSLYSSKYPILDKLPIIVSEYINDEYVEFRIDGGEYKDCDFDFCLFVTDSTGNNLEYAKQKIKELGFTPSDYQILYLYTPIIPLE